VPFSLLLAVSEGFTESFSGIGKGLDRERCYWMSWNLSWVEPLSPWP
jgi:hypothetical protein